MRAPEFERVEGFDKSSNGLWEISTAIRHSMVFVHLDASMIGKDLELSTFYDLDLLKHWHLDGGVFATEWKQDYNFNWKLASE